ncbi:MAG: PhzF family phenazine biosynthesis protein, partial [Burkholderiales bacterium]|nr:PhzF family phenazine biosynthesis protein [Burkholderiales bacterium]
GSADVLTLECKAGIVAMTLSQDVWTLTAPTAGAPALHACAVPDAEIAAMLGLGAEDLLSSPMWVNTGSDQLLIPLRTPAAVQRAALDSKQLGNWPRSSLGRQTAYVFAPAAADGFASEATGQGGRTEVIARYFFAKQGGGIAEDPGTGSACANLGAWWMAGGRRNPASLRIVQGQQIQRPCTLYLDVTPDQRIRVGGRVVEIGRGVIEI